MSSLIAVIAITLSSLATASPTVWNLSGPVRRRGRRLVSHLLWVSRRGRRIDVGRGGQLGWPHAAAHEQAQTAQREAVLQESTTSTPRVIGCHGGPPFCSRRPPR